MGFELSALIVQPFSLLFSWITDGLHPASYVEFELLLLLEIYLELTKIHTINVNIKSSSLKS